MILPYPDEYVRKFMKALNIISANSMYVTVSNDYIILESGIYDDPFVLNRGEVDDLTFNAVKNKALKWLKKYP